MDWFKEDTPSSCSDWDSNPPSPHLPATHDSKLLLNPNPSKKTYYIKLSRGRYEAWHRNLEWIWASQIKNGSWLFMIVSHRGIFVRHDDTFFNKLAVTKEKEEYERNFLKIDTEKICQFKREEFSHNTRIIVIAPESKPTEGYLAERANAFAQFVAGVAASNLELKVEVVTYNDATVKTFISDEPEFGTVEIHFDGEEYTAPRVYINGNFH